VHGACTMQWVCVGPLEEGKNFGKIFSFFKRGENIVKGEGNLGEGEIRMIFVLLSVMILKLTFFSLEKGERNWV
jgi:hypothetical protein